LSVFDAIRAAAREVAARARFVHIDREALAALADRLAGDLPAPGVEDPAHLRLATSAETIAFVVTLDAVNFGSGWFPVLRKPEGKSGYFTIATALRSHFEARGAWKPAELREMTREHCTRIFGQDPANPESAELMQLFARALVDLGEHLDRRCGGRFEGLVERAGGRASALVPLLAEMPFYRDVSVHRGDGDELEVPLYKRAQITASDLAQAFDETGPGRFEDLDQLTIFADNLVPHVLRCEGVLRYAPSLARRIDEAELLPAGSAPEIEIRAVALHAVEEMVARLRSAGARVRARAPAARDLDSLLWSRGQSPRIKSRNRHRTRCVSY